MVLEPICCPTCHSPEVIKNGKSNEGKQRYRCRNADCSRASFILDYTY
ncbi:MAG: IS1 family transposase [Leptolyngbyaceae cyanobacterium]